MNPVIVLAGVSMSEKHAAIRYERDRFVLYLLDVLVAESVNARHLATWAFNRGAWSVVHDYDHRLAD